MTNLESWIALSMVPEIGNITFKKLLSVYGTPDEVFKVPLKDLSRTKGVGKKEPTILRIFHSGMMWKNS